MKKFLLILLCCLMALSLTNCIFDSDSDSNSNDESISGPTDIQSDSADSSGNIVVNNNSGERLVLFKGDTRLKVIPNDNSDFLINISNPSGSVVDLRLYKLNDIWEDDLFDNPIQDYLFKRWNVPLSEDTELEHRVTWHIRANTDELTTGSLILQYTGGTDNYVEVYLNNQTGAKLATLKAGDVKTYGIDYGIYTLHYRYLYDDPNDVLGPEEVGWVSSENVMSEEVDIYVLLNTGTNQCYKIIPHYGIIPDSFYGGIEITNNTATPITIWVGNNLISNVAYNTPNHTANSTIASQNTTTYTLLERDTPYNFIAKDQLNNTVSTNTIIISKDETRYWNISTGSQLYSWHLSDYSLDSTDLYSIDVHNGKLLIGGYGVSFLCQYGAVTSIPIQIESTFPISITGIIFLDDNFAYAVADGIVAFFNGNTWSELSNSPNGISDIATLSQDNLWAITHSYSEMSEISKILYYSTGNWVEQYECNCNLYDIKIINNNSAIATSKEGKIFSYDGTSWSQIENLGAGWIPEDVSYFRDILAFSNREVWLSGGFRAQDDIIITHYSHGFIQNYILGEQYSTAPFIFAIDGTEQSNIWFGGSYGFMYHWNGSDMIEYNITNHTGSIIDIKMISNYLGYAICSNGEIFVYSND